MGATEMMSAGPRSRRWGRKDGRTANANAITIVSWTIIRGKVGAVITLSLKERHAVVIVFSVRKRAIYVGVRSYLLSTVVNLRMG